MLTSVLLELSHLSWRGWVVVKGVGVMRESEVEGGREAKVQRLETVQVWNSSHTHHTHTPSALEIIFAINDWHFYIPQIPDAFFWWNGKSSNWELFLSECVIDGQVLSVSWISFSHGGVSAVCEARALWWRDGSLSIESLQSGGTCVAPWCAKWGSLRSRSVQYWHGRGRCFSFSLWFSCIRI